MIISLKKFNIQRPEKLIYEFPLPSNSHDLINQIKSKGLRSFLANIDEVLEKNNIIWTYKDLTEQEFNEWLPYYTKKMKEHDYDIRAEKNWHEEQTKKGIKIKAIFLYQNKKLVGSGIFTFHNKIANFAYKASDRIAVSSQASSSIGSIIEFLFLKKISESGVYKTVSNRSRNGFGFFNTLGYLELKLRFGYKIRPAPNATLLDDVPINEKGATLFFGLQKGEFILFALQPEIQKGREFFNKSRFIAFGIPFKEIHY